MQTHMYEAWYCYCMDTKHSSISPTAKLTAYMRAETNIAYSQEIARICDAQKVSEDLFGLSGDDREWHPSLFELRYKSLSACLKKEMNERGISQVLELGAGVLPRGMVMSKNSEITYVETDLHDIIEEKRNIIKEIDLSILARDNYFLRELNVVSQDDFTAVKKVFAGGKLAVINEGLLTYLSPDEKATVVKNIHALLNELGGVWITPDLSNSDRMKKIIEIYPGAAGFMNKNLGRVVGRNLRNNSVSKGSGKAAAVKFYEDLGFSSTEYKAMGFVDSLDALDKIEDLSKRKKLFAALNTSCVWVLEAK